MKILASYNIKGGVGKTATAVNLAWLAAAEGARTLIWDLDPQAATSFYFRVQPRVRGGASPLVQGLTDIDAIVKGTDFDGLDLLPADFSYRNMDLFLGNGRSPTLQLMRLLRPLAREYDYLIIDCPPSITLVSENVFRAADAMLVPMIPTTLSLRTYDQLLAFFNKHQLQQTTRLMPFFSLLDEQRPLHLKMLDLLPRRYPEILPAYIPEANEVERMGIFRAPLFAYAAECHAAECYRRLWATIKERL